MQFVGLTFLLIVFDFFWSQSKGVLRIFFGGRGIFLNLPVNPHFTFQVDEIFGMIFISALSAAYFLNIWTGNNKICFFVIFLLKYR